MSVLVLDTLLEAGLALADRVWPNPKDKAKAQKELLELHQQGDLAKLQAHITLMQSQAEINLADAKSGSFFQAGWRPAIGWVGALCLALTYIPKALVLTYVWTKQTLIIMSKWDGAAELIIPAFPPLGVADIIGLLTSMLGIAALRTYEKQQKIDTK